MAVKFFPVQTLIPELVGEFSFVSQREDAGTILDSHTVRLSVLWGETMKNCFCLPKSKTSFAVFSSMEHRHCCQLEFKTPTQFELFLRII